MIKTQQRQMKSKKYIFQHLKQNREFNQCSEYVLKTVLCQESADNVSRVYFANNPIKLHFLKNYVGAKHFCCFSSQSLLFGDSYE